MGLLDSIRGQFLPSPEYTEAVVAPASSRPGTAAASHKDEGGAREKNSGAVDVNADVETKNSGLQHNLPVEAGVARVEAAQAVWGKYGKKLIIAGLAMMMIMYELDNSTVYIYQQYSTSSFNSLSLLASLSTAGTIVFAVIKPPIAKLSNIIGRGETYILTITCYILSYILCASAKSINQYAAGYIFYCVGQSGTNIMNDIIISDISTARWRGLALGISFFPFLITPWVAAYITSSVVGGIGWRWGIGMLAILMPFCASFIIITLLHYQGRAKAAGLVPAQKTTVYDFCSQIDLGGSILFSCGFAMLLLPLTLASTTTSRWRTPYVDVLIALGGIFLVILPFYEYYVAKFPVVPIHYFKNLSIVCAVLLIATDSLGFSCSHTYIYAWATITHNFSTKIATFYTYTNGVTQTLAGMVAGVIMLKTRRYKWLIMAACVIRIVGYGIMIRLRGSNNTIAELFIVQLIQGIGSGIIQTTVIVSAQIQVPHSHLAQITALVVCCSVLGGSIGSSIAGGIYTNTFKEQLSKQLGANATSAVVDGLYNSITGVLPDWESADRVAINVAYSNVMRYFTYTALGSSIPAFVLAYLVPDVELPDQNNLVDEH